MTSEATMAGFQVPVTVRRAAFDFAVALAGFMVFAVAVLLDGKSFYGTGASTDIVEAAVHAYLSAINKYLALKSTLEPTPITAQAR